MKDKWKELFESMQKAFHKCRQTTVSESQQVEESFRIALEYWEHLKVLFRANVLIGTNIEIEFFKVIKPSFTCYIEYYLLINQALLFLPAEKEKHTLYWKEQEKRCNRFQERNSDFINYYESGMDHKDVPFFTLSLSYHFTSASERIYDDDDCRSNFDHLVRGLLSHKMYHDYIYQKLGIIM